MDNRTVVRVAGELDLASATDLQAQLERVSGPLDIDCSRLEFIDLAGLRVFVQAVASHGQVTLHHAPPLLVKVATLAGWDSILNISTIATPRGKTARVAECCPDAVLK
jgi:anti-anti-sigma factor